MIFFPIFCILFILSKMSVVIFYREKTPAANKVVAIILLKIHILIRVSHSYSSAIAVVLIRDR